MKKIISIVGATTTGKTSFALQLAKQALAGSLDQSLVGKVELYQGVDLISVDSRQVYKGLEILSGADVPSEFIRKVKPNYNFFRHQSLPITLHGVSLIDLTSEWSVAHFKQLATRVILDSFKHQRLPILVGGTGLYHRHLFNKDKSLYVPPNLEIRAKASQLDLVELQTWAQKVNPAKYALMNHSDVNNPRRLVRLIELSLAQPQELKVKQLPDDIELVSLGLKLNLNLLKERILTRVELRFEQGVVAEAEKLIKLCTQRDLPVCSTLGLAQLSDFINGKISKEACISSWVTQELQYAKRQLTWFKKQPEITWLS